MIGVSYRNVRRWINSGRFPGFEDKTKKKYSFKEMKEILAEYDRLINEGYRNEVAREKVDVTQENLQYWRKKPAKNAKLNQSEKNERSTLANPPTQITKKDKELNRTRRSFSIEQKKEIVAQFISLVDEGFRCKVAYEKLGISQATIDRWRKQFATASNNNKPHEDTELQIKSTETRLVTHDEGTDHVATNTNIIAEEATMAKTGKKAKRTRKPKTTKVVKKKTKNEPDLKAKGKPGPTLPTKGQKAKTKAAASKADKSQAKAKTNKTSKKSKRYSAQEKKDILAKYNSLRNSGTNAYEAAEKVGISYITIRSWEKKKGLGRRTKGSGGTVPAKTTPTKTGGISMVLPNGNRIEGLTLDQVIKIAKTT